MSCRKGGNRSIPRCCDRSVPYRRFSATPGTARSIIRQVEAWQAVSPPLQLLGLHACKTSCRLATNQAVFRSQLRGSYTHRLWLTLGSNFIQTPNVSTRKTTIGCVEDRALGQIRGSGTYRYFQCGGTLVKDCVTI